MVHKKYVRRNGKVFGPYLYETKRVNGRVVTSYVGPAPPEDSVDSFELGNEGNVGKEIIKLGKWKVDRKSFWIGGIVLGVLISAFFALFFSFVFSSVIFGPEGVSEIDLGIGEESVLFAPSGNVFFTDPTFPDGETTQQRNIPINVSINGESLTEIRFNWNGTDYTLYDDSLVLMMNLNDVSVLGENDTYAVDVSGYSNNGTISGAVVNDSGRYGEGFNFKGDDDYIRVPNDNDTLQFGTGSFSAAAWIRPYNTPVIGLDFEGSRIVNNRGWGNKRTAGWQLKIFNDSNQWGIFDSLLVDRDQDILGCNSGYCGTQRFSFNEWHHVAMVFDNDVDELKFYVDGNLIYLDGSIVAHGDGVIDDITSNNTLDTVIGASLYREAEPDSPSQVFNGTIDEVMIFNRTLSDSEIQQFYFSNLHKYDTDKWALFVNQSRNSTDGLRNGTYSYQVVAELEGGFHSTELREIQIGPDLFSPTLHWTAFPSGKVNGESVRFEGYLEDNFFGENVSLWLKNGTHSYEMIFVNSTRSKRIYLSYGFNSTPYVTGTVLKFKLAGHDTAGNYDETDNLTLEVDHDAPILSLNPEDNPWITPKHQWYKSGESLTFRINVSDGSGAGIDFVRINLTNVNGSGFDNMTQEYDLGPGEFSTWIYTAVVDTSSRVNKRIDFYVIDAATPDFNDANLTIVYSVDSDAPYFDVNTLIYSPNPAFKGDNVTHSLRWLDDHSGLDTCVFSTNATGSFINYSIDVAGGADDCAASVVYPNKGNFSYIFYVNDTKGNSADSGFFDIEIFETGGGVPFVRFVDPTLENGSSTVNSYVEVNATVIESDLNEVKFNWNGTNYILYDDSVILMYNFDNVSAIGENDTYVIDVSGQANNGTIKGPVWNIGGKYNKGLFFDGVDDYIDVNSFDTFDWDLSYAIMAWYKSSKTSVSDDEVIIFNIAGEDEVGFGPTDDPDNADRVRFDLGITGGGSAYGTTDVVDQQWHHLAVSRNATHVSVFVDGVLEGTLSTAAEATLSGEFYIGDDPGNTEQVDGTLDELIIFNRSLSADEIQQLYFSNLHKYDTEKWTLFVNQSRNSTDRLDSGIYSYFVSVKDVDGNLGSTETRFVNVVNDFVFPLIYYLNGTEEDGAVVDRDWIYIDVEIIEESLSSTNFNLYGSSGELIDSVEGNYYGFDLNNYVINISDLDLGLSLSDISGVTYNSVTDSLFIINNGPEEILEIDKEGNVLRTVSLLSFDDTEGIVYLNSSGEVHRFAVVEELRADLSIIWINDTTSSIELSEAETYDLGTMSGEGLEGVSYDWDRDLFYVVRRASPKRVMAVNISASPVGISDLFDAESKLSSFEGFDDIYYENVTDTLFLTSGSPDNVIVHVNLNGDQISQLSTTIPDSEGTGFDVHGREMYVVGEPDKYSLYRTDNFTSKYNFTGLSNGFYEYDVKAEDIFGNANTTERRNITLGIPEKPEIINISDINTETIIPGDVKDVEFFVEVFDPNGAGDISLVNASFNRGNVYRNDLVCSFVSLVDSNTGNYSCTVEIWYFDEAGEWNVSATAEDSSGLVSDYYNETFVLAETSAFVLGPGGLKWSGLNPGGEDVFADEFMLVNNTGNDGVSDGGVLVEGRDLIGVSDDSFSIPAGSFVVNIDSGFGCVGDFMINGTNVTISSAEVPIGNNSINNMDGSSGQEQLYFCIDSVPSGLSSQEYSADGENSWELTLIVIPVLLVFASKREMKVKGRFLRRRRKMHG